MEILRTTGTQEKSSLGKPETVITPRREFAFEVSAEHLIKAGIMKHYISLIFTNSLEMFKFQLLVHLRRQCLLVLRIYSGVHKKNLRGVEYLWARRSL